MFPIGAPYPGLRAFARDESYLFFGRDAAVDEMVEALSKSRFLAVLGASGSGKSSLVRTGLLSALDMGLHPAGADWAVVDIHPGAAPLRALAEALCLLNSGAGAPALDVDLTESFLMRGPSALGDWIEDGNFPRGRNLLLLVDQFEELFRYQTYADREKAEAFVALLLESARLDIGVHVVLTMRSEFLGACAQIPELPERIAAGVFLTRRMTREECREAIEGPAGVAGFEIEPALVNRLLNAISSFSPWEEDGDDTFMRRMARQADQLPLLQHTLNRLWRAASERAGGQSVTLRVADYESIGGVEGALDKHAAEVMASLSQDDRHIVSAVFGALVDGDGLADAVRRPRSLDELVQRARADRVAVERVVDAFRAEECGFLRPPTSEVLTGSTVVDIAHESLIRQWKDLAGWFQQGALEQRAIARLTAESVEWAARGKPTDRLIPAGGRMDEARLQLDKNAALLGPQTIEFIEASEVENESRRKADNDRREAAKKAQKRRLYWASGAALFFAGCLVVVAMLWLNLSTTYLELEDKNAKLLETSDALHKQAEELTARTEKLNAANVRAEDAALQALEAQQRAERGLDLTLQAFETLAESTATSGARFDEVMKEAEGKLADIMPAGAQDANAQLAEVLTLRKAALLLSFARASLRLGDFDGIERRVGEAQDLLLSHCPDGTPGSAACRMLLAESFRESGRYLNLTAGNEPEKYRAAMQVEDRALAILDGLGPATPGISIARSEVLRLRSRIAAAIGDTQKARDFAALCAAGLEPPLADSPSEDARQLARAKCLLAEAQSWSKGDGADRDRAGKLAEAAEAMFATIGDQDDIEVLDWRAYALNVAAERWIEDGENQQAAERLQTMGSNLQRHVLGNPQNQPLADTLAVNLDLRRRAFDNLGRRENAIAAAEERLRLILRMTDGPLAADWRALRSNGRADLAALYGDRRGRDALDVWRAEAEDLRSQLGGSIAQDKPLPPAYGRALRNVAYYARRVGDGVAALEASSRVLDDAELQRLEEVRSGSASETEYRPYNYLAMEAIANMSAIGAADLPAEMPAARKVDLLTQIVDRIRPFAEREPRVWDLGNWLAKSLANLAVAEEDAGQIAAAVATHDAASAAGSRLSSIILRRWALEGLNGVPVDEQRAEIYEKRVMNIDADAFWDVELRDLGSGSVSKRSVRVPEAGDAATAIAEASYWQRKYQNAEFTPEARTIIEKIYELARVNKETVGSLIKRERDSGGSDSRIVKFSEDARLKEIEKAITESEGKDPKHSPAELLRLAIDTGGEAAGRSNVDLVLAAENYSRIAQLAAVAKDQETERRADELRAAFSAPVLAEDPQSSAQRLNTAQFLSYYASSARQHRLDDLAIAYYRRAIELREKVAREDPENSECACTIASLYEDISRIRQDRSDHAAAIREMQSAHGIRERLALLEPTQHWRRGVAASAERLADLYGAAGNHEVALDFAEQAEAIRREFAAYHGADSTQRIEHARALELIAGNAYSRAVAFGKEETDLARPYLVKAEENYRAANAIRKSVLIVDRSNGECRCLLASNFGELAKVYGLTGQPELARAARLERIEAFRLQSRDEPDQRRWQISLASALLDYSINNSAESIDERKADLRVRQEARHALEAANALAELSKSELELLRSAEYGISFGALFSGEFETAIAAADKAAALATTDFDKLWPLGNKAHALMFLGRDAEAMEIYRRHQDVTMGESSWAAGALDDFRIFRELGLFRPGMEAAEAIMQAAVDRQKAGN